MLQPSEESKQRFRAAQAQESGVARRKGPRLTGEEREYWRAFKAASQYYARENALDKIEVSVAHQLRHDFHREFLRGSDRSHGDFDHDDYSVAIAWLRKYAEGGLIAAATLDLDQIRDDSKRARYFWSIDHGKGRAYCAPMARSALHLAEYEALDWATVPTPVLFQIARASTTRSRSSASAASHRGLSAAGRSANLRNELCHRSASIPACEPAPATKDGRATSESAPLPGGDQGVGS
jgi:hypothetical protein